MSAFRFQAYGATDVGRQRACNEDRLFCHAETGVFIVVDGVGGYAAGEVAASLACDLVGRRLTEGEAPAAERLSAAIVEANNEIYRCSRTDPAYTGMACVLTAAIVEERQVTVGHVGDTRLYEVRRDGIRKVTRDHSPVGVREDTGDLSELDAMRHPRRSEILRDLGSAPRDRPDDFVDLYQFDWAPDSALLLCSDGLTDLVPKRALHQVLLDNAGDPVQGVRTLIELANEMGGDDNVTAVVVEGAAFHHTPLVAPAETFAASVLPEADDGAADRAPRPLRSRPAVFVYGWLAGCLLSVLPLMMVYAMLDHRLPAGAASQPGRGVSHTLRVAPAGEGTFRTIGAALRAAHPGDVVTVAPGVYQETLRLKDSVAVLGPGTGMAVLQAYPAASSDTVVVIAREVHGVRLSGFTVEGAAVGIYLRDADVEIVDVEVREARWAGVLIEGDTEALLRANFIVDNTGSGVSVRGSGARPRLVQNVIRRNGAAREAPGVLIESGARPVLRRNVIVENAAEGIRLDAAHAGDTTEYRQHNFFLVGGEGALQRPVQFVR